MIQRWQSSLPVSSINWRRGEVNYITKLKSCHPWNELIDHFDQLESPESEAEKKKEGCNQDDDTKGGQNVIITVMQDTTKLELGNSIRPNFIN